MGERATAVSIIIPSLNSPLIDQVAAAIVGQAQAEVIREIVVVGKDEAGLLPVGGRVRLLDTGQPVPPGTARNLGIRAATADLLIFLDSDCLPQPGWLAAHLAAHQAGHAVVGGGVLPDGENYWALSYNLTMFHEYFSTAMAGKRPLLPTLNLSVERQVIETVGLLNEALPRSQDLDWTTRMNQAGFSPYFWPEAAIQHRHNRTTAGKVWQDCARSGHFARQARLAHRETLGTPLWLRWRWLVLLLSPLIAAAVTGKILGDAAVYPPPPRRRHTGHLPEQNRLVLGREPPRAAIMTQPTVLAITLNWRQAETTLACARALQAMAYPNLSILVIDNGSGDGSAARLAAELPPEARLRVLPENLGFAAGNNVGLREAIAQKFDFALLVNNDAFAAPDMLARLLAETAPDVGLVSPKIFYAAARERIWFGDGRMHPITLDLRGTGRDQMDGPDWQHSRDADYVLGTCLLVNLQGITAVGLLDEQFFMYFEDLDWSLRWRQAGFRLRLAADAHLYHQVALSSGGLESAARRYYLARSGVIFWRRHARLGRPWVIFLFRLGSGVKMVARLLLRGETAVARAYLRGLRDGWRASA